MVLLALIRFSLPISFRTSWQFPQRSRTDYLYVCLYDGYMTMMSVCGAYQKAKKLRTRMEVCGKACGSGIFAPLKTSP
jgi:hypothetical protein